MKKCPACDMQDHPLPEGSSRGLGKAAVVAAVDGNTYQVSSWIYFKGTVPRELSWVKIV
jgi:hypothetical protein